MNYFLETLRLRMRPFVHGDGGFIIDLLNSPGWLQFIGDRNVRTNEEAIAYLENGPIKSYREHGYGLALVERKEDGVPVGMCGILHRSHLNHPDIGFAFLPAYCGKGYAREIADALIRHARSQWGLETIVAITLAENARSIALLEKIGMKYSGTTSHPGSSDKLLLFTT